jgi:hypothetical protein
MLALTLMSARIISDLQRFGASSSRLPKSWPWMAVLASFAVPKVVA